MKKVLRFIENNLHQRCKDNQKGKRQKSTVKNSAAKSKK
ncbi:conserved hypothetical protein [Capnocytophaga canimorsus]|nr:conserved hypothetical protein [Capnocytophaga canimorsus]